MTMRLISTRGSMVSSRRITAEVCRPTHRLIEMIWARTGWGRAFDGSEQSVASVDHRRRFQSSASMRVLKSFSSALEASIRAWVTWPNSRYSASRGFSARAAAVLYA